jgi:hypothetical protein
MKNYKWDSPYMWLEDKSENQDAAWLRQALLSLALLCDSDLLQDIFESEMDEDRYFDKVKE